MEARDEILVSSGFEIDYAHTIITRDINCRECILDLIDNSIDSARRAIVSSSGRVDHTGLPVDYSGYEISVGLKNNSFYVEDTCFGISPEEIENRLLVIGKLPRERLSIGSFGVGLKRALLKIGKTYSISTSYEGNAYRLIFSSEDLIDSGMPIYAKKLTDQSNESFTQVVISDLTESANREILESISWQTEIIEEIGVRYGVFIKKGLVIKYNNIPVKPLCPSVKKFKTIEVQRDIISSVPGDVVVKIEAGLHEKYLFKDPASPDLPIENKELTSEYGWYFVCNDRVIKKACIEESFGWAKRWHPEYYGFVGWVFFTGAADDLPWNTKKTDIDPNSEVFEAIKSKLKNYATAYRRQNRKLRDSLKENGTELIDSQQQNLIENSSQEDFGTITPGGNNTSVRPNDNGVTSTNAAANSGEATNSTPAAYDGGAFGDVKKPKKITKIEKSKFVEERIYFLRSNKLSQLYESLCTVSLITHPVLVSVGAWAFFETLSKLAGYKGDSSFSSFLNNKVNFLYKDREKKKSYKKIINDISERGNLDKHDGYYYTIDARQLAVDFDVIEPFLIDLLDEIIASIKAE
ncbi:ATP-binding protein [Halomonas sp. KM-1]|uniref:ATP-binding protein n=1 Tax=Halomonas sp. KM-1 TaxID=590061 RepID=UPI000288058B|nr:ATP-binding protein [Halomonas sp. KM-1]